MMVLYCCSIRWLPLPSESLILFDVSPIALVPLLPLFGCVSAAIRALATQAGLCCEPTVCLSSHEELRWFHHYFNFLSFNLFDLKVVLFFVLKCSRAWLQYLFASWSSP